MRKKRSSYQAFIGPLVDIYDVRAQALIGSISPAETIGDRLEKQSQAHQRARLSVLYALGSDRNENPGRVVDYSPSRATGPRPNGYIGVLRCPLGSQPNPFGSTEAQIFENLALDWTLHQTILQSVTKRGKTVRELKAPRRRKLQPLYV